jgi:hypothetical protein
MYASVSGAVDWPQPAASTTAISIRTKRLTICTSRLKRIRLIDVRG